MVSRLIADEIGRTGLDFEPSFESHQLTTIGGMVANGLGVSIIPSLSANQMTQLGAVCLALREPIIKREVGILCRRKQPLSSAAEAMRDSLRSTFSDDKICAVFSGYK